MISGCTKPDNLCGKGSKGHQTRSRRHLKTAEYSGGTHLTSNLVENMTLVHENFLNS